MTKSLLTLNAGSSSLKFALFSAETLAEHGRGEIEHLGAQARLAFRPAQGPAIAHTLSAEEGGDHHAALKTALATIAGATPHLDVSAVGHRIVHGGMQFSKPALIDETVYAALAALEPLAPLHQPHNLAGVRAARKLFPGAPQIGCFDTAFHRGHDFAADAYGLPRAMYDEGLRRYGFHGLSYEFLSGRLREVAPEAARGRVVIAHLGNGASMCGLRDGRSVASTMGFSTLDGLMMGTRSGSIDPGVVLHLILQEKMTAAEVSKLLNKQSGLLGVSGISSDVRNLEASPEPQAAEALELFAYRVIRETGSLIAALGGLDAFVFTAGIGENSARMRTLMTEGLDFMGLSIDSEKNNAARGREAEITAEGSRVRTFVIPTNEEYMIAYDTKRIVAEGLSSLDE